LCVELFKVIQQLGHFKCFTVRSFYYIEVVNQATNISAVLAGTQGLAKSGEGTLMLNAANTYTGGTLISAGTLVASHEGSLGTGPVTNNATLNLNRANVTFSGLSNSLSGNGLVNVTALGTGTNCVNLNGDYTGFTGIWNIGVCADAGAGKVQMSGADNALASIKVLTNGTLLISSGIHHAAITLNGGNTGESFGQLCIDGDNSVWAGPVTLAGDMTESDDGIVGSHSSATISGLISESGGSRDLTKSGYGTLILSASNTYTGITRILNGTLRVPTLNDAGSAGPVGTHATISLGSLSDFGVLEYTGSGEITNRVINLAGTTGGGGLVQSGTGLLKFTSDLTATGVGTKDLFLYGSSVGQGEFAGRIVNDNGTTGVLKLGTGTWELSGNNSYTGATTVGEGTLLVNGNQSSANGTVIVWGGVMPCRHGTLGGHGTLGAAVTVYSGGTVAPGTLTGTLTVASADFSPGGILAINVNDCSTPMVGTLNVTGSLNISGASLAITVTGSAVQSVYIIARYAPGQLTGIFANTTGLPAGYSVVYNYKNAAQIALVQSTYSLWAMRTGLTSGVNDAPTDDPDKDGISNAVEFVIGGNPATGMDSALLPTLELLSTDLGAGAANYFCFTYRHTENSVAAGVTAGAEYSTDLTGIWIQAVNGTGGVKVVEAKDFHGAGIDRVQVYIPRAANDPIFGRLKVVVP
jgi:autotransporter-associated beta strand protein